MRTTGRMCGALTVLAIGAGWALAGPAAAAPPSVSLVKSFSQTFSAVGSFA